MNPLHFLYAAYGITWLLLGGYIAGLILRGRRLARERRELGMD